MPLPQNSTTMRTNSMIVNIFVALVAIFIATSCADALHNEMAPKEAAPTPVDYEPLDGSSVVVNYSDGTKDWNVQHSWTLEAEDTIRVNGVEAFKATEPLSKKAQDELLFGYNYQAGTTGATHAYWGAKSEATDPPKFMNGISSK